jgi:gliding motility-associated protein GldM
MALPAEPRQKMINLMYLVLTALLALNVSAEILNAFKTVDRSLISTNTTINASTATIMKSLETKTTEAATAEKAKIWYAKAQQAQAMTTDMNNYIESIRMKILQAAEFDPKKNGDSSFKQDNLDIATRILVEEGEGKKLHDKLTKYRAALLGLDPGIAKEYGTSLQIDVSVPPAQNDGHGGSEKNRTWEGAYFRMVPTVAAITILSKFQNDIKTSENKVVEYCHKQVGQVEVRFDKFAPIVGQSGNYLMPGQELTITAGVGAFNSMAQPKITIGGSSTTVVDGVATFTTKVGQQSGAIPIVINYVDQENKPQTFRTEAKYTIGQSNAAIALPEMNVLYIGIDNKVVVSAGGVGAEKLRVGISQGSITGSNGNYTARVANQTDNCIITVSTLDGKQLGSLGFRVRNIPKAVASVGGMESGATVGKNAFSAQAGVGAGIRDFPLALKYSVQSFQLVADDPETGDVAVIDCQGNTWNDRARRALTKLQSGSIVTIENIRCLGPDGRVQTLPSLMYNIK